jgi:hypothetical protein
MRSCRFTRRRFRCLLPVGVVAMLLGLTPCCLADPSATRPAESPLTLQACRQIALEQQPALSAAQATLKAAIDRANAIEHLHVPTFLARDLPIRRKQSALGVVIAQGGLTHAEADTLYGVTFSYLAALYAAQQYKMADTQIRQRLEGLKTLVTDPKIRKDRRDVILEEHAKWVMSFLSTLEGRTEEARQGRQRALAALREGMGVGRDFPISIPDRDLPCPRIVPKLEELIALAQSRRGELVQTNTLVEIVALEIEAQAAICRSNVRTFASGADLHSKPISSGSAGLQYQPAAIGPDMPPSLTGSRAARVEQARDYHRRSEAVAAKTRNLIALEVEDLYHRWRERSSKAIHLEKAYHVASIFSEKLKNSFNPKMPGYPNIDEVIAAGIITTRLQLEWKEAHYHSLLALAALERATAGGFYVDFDTAPPCDGGALGTIDKLLKKP